MTAALPLRRLTPVVLTASAPCAFERPKEQTTICPVGIFVARKSQFDVFVTGHISAPKILDHLFPTMPLATHGWSRAVATINLGARQADGFLWTVRRRG